MELAGALAVVTGATQGIGRAIGVALGQAGAKLAICARTDAAVRATLGDWNRAGIDAIGMRCDVSDPACVEDRKSTRLNSSHGYISYAVFCLKKKKKTNAHYGGGTATTGTH